MKVLNASSLPPFAPVINNILPAVQHGPEIGKGGVAQGGQVDMREKEGTEYACQQPMNLD